MTAPRPFTAQPIEVLGLAERIESALKGWGVRTVGAFLALPEAALVSRFGESIRDTHAQIRQHAEGDPIARLERRRLLDWRAVSEPIDDTPSEPLPANVIDLATWRRQRGR